MFKPLSIYLGLRYIRSKNKNGFGSFISASSTFGIALGVVVLIVGLSAMNGFERALEKSLLSVIPHSELIGVNQPLTDWQKTVQQVQQHPNVIAAAPMIKLQGMMQKKALLKGVELRGVDPLLEHNVSALPDYIVEGAWQDLSKENGVVIGAGIAKKLAITVGDRVQMLLAAPNSNSNVKRQLGALQKRNMTVVGIFKFGGEIDAGQAYISLAQAANILNYSSKEAQGVRLKVDDVFNVSAITRQVGRSLDEYLYLPDWTREAGHLYNDIQLVRMVMYIAIALVIAVASFNIVSTLIMAVNEKQSDIAILKTMGASPITIMFSFVLQGLINGVNGCLIGGVLGVIIAKNLTGIIETIEQLLNIKVLSGDVYFIDYIPSHVIQSDVVTTIFIALTMSILATIYPALRATKVEPAQILGQS